MLVTSMLPSEVSHHQMLALALVLLQLAGAMSSPAGARRARQACSALYGALSRVAKGSHLPFPELEAQVQLVQCRTPCPTSHES